MRALYVAPRAGELRASAEAEVNPGAVPGTALRILEYPHPLLRTENAPIVDFGPELAALASEMLLVMYASQGVGLAAPQVGINRRLMVVNWSGDPEEVESELVLCNPQILYTSKGKDLDIEGCLSFPGFTADVARSRSIKVRYDDLDGKPQKMTLKGWEARVFQHEYDHIDAVLYVDRLDAAERERVQGDLDALVDAYAADPVAGPPRL